MVDATTVEPAIHYAFMTLSTSKGPCFFSLMGLGHINKYGEHITQLRSVGHHHLLTISRVRQQIKYFTLPWDPLDCRWIVTPANAKLGFSQWCMNKRQKLSAIRWWCGRLFSTMGGMTIRPSIRTSSSLFWGTAVQRPWPLSCREFIDVYCIYCCDLGVLKRKRCQCRTGIHTCPRLWCWPQRGTFGWVLILCCFLRVLFMSPPWCLCNAG